MTYVALREQKKKKEIDKSTFDNFVSQSLQTFSQKLENYHNFEKKRLYNTGMIQIIQISVRNPNPYKTKTAENSKKNCRQKET